MLGSGSRATVQNKWPLRGSAIRSILLLVLGLALGVSASEIASFETPAGGWHLGAVAVGNLDSTPELEIVIPYRDASATWCLDALAYTGERLPGFPYGVGGEPINVSPTLFDLDGDGRQEILFTRGAQVIALRGNGTVLWSNTVNSANYVPNGGYQTVPGGFYWFPGGTWLSHLPASATFCSEVSSPMVVDLEGDGNYEVITAWKIRPDPSGVGQDFNPFILPVYGVGDWGTMGETWSGGVVTFGDGISAPTEHWLEWSSTKTAYATHNRPALPYPFYFTPHLRFGTGNSDWVDVNRTFQLPAGFPNLEIFHRGNTWSDYDDIAFDMCLKAIPSQASTPRLSLSCSNASAPVVILDSPRGSVWQIESTEALTTNVWQKMETVTNTAGGMHIISDTGQHSRPPPGSVRQRAYRAVPF